MGAPGRVCVWFAVRKWGPSPHLFCSLLVSPTARHSAATRVAGAAHPFRGCAPLCGVDAPRLTQPLLCWGKPGSVWFLCCDSATWQTRFRLSSPNPSSAGWVSGSRMRGSELHCTFEGTPEGRSHVHGRGLRAGVCRWSLCLTLGPSTFSVAFSMLLTSLGPVSLSMTWTQGWGPS